MKINKKSALILLPVIFLFTLPTVSADEALAKKDNCMACHSVDHKIIGPAFKDVAAKYKGDDTAEARLITKVKNGGGGVWGGAAMPPNSSVSDADIETLVKWILSL